jgi:uncharacterized repeat protein (TIGR01451 family)
MNTRRNRIVFVPLLVALFGLALAAGLSIGRVSIARAATPVYVRTDGDDANCNGTTNAPYPGSGGPGLDCAFATVDWGIYSVDPGGTVHVAAGVYTENVGMAGNVTVQGVGEGSTIIDGGGSGRVIYIGSNSKVTISGMTIRNGNLAGSGGGIGVMSWSALTLTQTTVSSNTATGDGGGIYIANQSAATIYHSTITSNTSSGSYGGGIHAAAPNTTLSISDSTIEDNYAALNGGGVYHNAGSLTIQDSTVISNAAGGNGGGILKAGGTLNVDGSTIISNTAGEDGGGISTSSNVSAISNSTLSGNRANGTNAAGGGIFNDGHATLANVTLVGNVSNHHGGGIHSQDPMTLTNVTVSGNTAQFWGAGIEHTGSVTMAIVNGTIVSNTISSGDGAGGLVVYSPLYLQNTIVAHNDNANCYIGSSPASVTSLGYSLESADDCGLSGPGDLVYADPSIGPLRDNGGDTWTHALLDDSVAVDAIPVLSCTVSADQRGVSRPQGPGCDVGAYERGQVTLSLTKTVDDDNPDPGQVVSFTIAVDNSGIVSATDALISDTLHLSLTLAGPVVLDPPQPGATLATQPSDLPTLASGLTISDSTRISLTFPVIVDAGALGAVITNTAAVTSTEAATPAVGSVTVSLESYVYLPLVLRGY